MYDIKWIRIVFCLVLIFLLASSSKLAAERLSHEQVLREEARAINQVNSGNESLERFTAADSIPFPDGHPEDAVSATFSWNDQFNIYVWRESGQLWAEIEPLTGEPFICSSAFTIFQEQIPYYTVKLETPSGDSQCGEFTEITVFHLTQWSIYEDLANLDEQFTLSYIGGKSNSLNIPALSADSYIYSYYLPYAKADPDYWSGVALRNSNESSGANVSVIAYDTEGIIIETVDKMLTPAGQEAFVVMSSQSIQEGWIRVDSDQPLTGLSFIGKRGQNYTEFVADITLIPELSSQLNVPHVAQAGEWETTVLICNPNSTSTTATLTFVDPLGVALYTKNYAIAANGSGKYDLSALVEGSSQPRGSVNISATQGVAAFVLYHNLSTGGSSFAGISAVDPTN